MSGFGSHMPSLQRLLRRFEAAQATSPEVAVTLADLGVELAHADRDGCLCRGWIAAVRPGRFWLTERGRLAIDGLAPLTRSHIAARLRAQARAEREAAACL